MILELTALGTGVGYWLRRRRHRKQSDLKALPETTQTSKQVAHLWSDIRSATQFTDRDQLLMDIDPEFRQSKEKAHNKVKRQMHLSLGALGIAGLAVVQPFFFPLGAVAIVYLSRENYKLIWRDFKRGHYLSFYLVSAVANLGMIATGHLILAAINALIFGFLARITNQLEDTAQSQLLTIFSAHSEQVWVVRQGVEIQVDFHTVEEGDHVIVTAGEVIPVDGRVISGMGQVDQHMLTGESQPVDRECGDDVFAATLLIAGRLEIAVATAGDKTVAKKITHVLSQTKDYKDAMILRGRELGDRFVAVKFALAGLALSTLGPNSAMAVMWANLGSGMSTIGSIIVMTYLQLLARQDIMVKDGLVFE